MGALEIVLIFIGVAFLLCSFFLPEKLSGKDLDTIAELSGIEINRIVEKKIEDAKVHVENDLDDAMEASYEKIIRQMEKDSNEKIMAINEYSDTVLENINKTHSEVMFLYSMLNDKYDELTNYANHLSALKEDIKEMESAREAMSIIQESYESQEEPEDDSKLTAEVEQSYDNHKEEILKLHKKGKSEVEIAKELSIGIGVVKLVLELYKGE